MAYSKITWSDGDIITADKMNNIEEGINNIDGKAVTSVVVGTTSYSPTGGVVTIPAYPKKVSELQNDSSFVISSDLDSLITELGYVKQSEVQEMIDAAIASLSAE